MAGTSKKLSLYLNAETGRFTIQMKKAGKSIKDFRKDTERLHGTGRGLSRVFQKAANSAALLEGPLGGVAGRLSALATAFRMGGATGATFAIGMSAVTASLFKAGLAGGELEIQMKRLEGVFTATGHAAGVSAEDVDIFAKKLGEDTLTSAAAVRQTAAALGTFTNIVGADFEKTITLGQDVAEVMGTGIRGATLQLAKALDEPLLGLNSLRRAGVSFTAQQKESIKHMMEWGRVFEAQEVIMAAVEAQLGGVAKAVANDSMMGAWDTFGELVVRVAEALDKVSGSSDFMKGFFNVMTLGLKHIEGELDPASQSLYALENQLISLDLQIQANERSLKSYSGVMDTVSGKRWKMLNKNAELEKKANETADLIREKRAKEAADAERKREAEAKKAIINRENMAMAAAKKQIEFDKIIDQERKKQASSGKFGAKQEGHVAEEEARYQAAVAAYDRRIEMIREKEGIITQIEEEVAITREMMRAEHVARHNEAIGEENKEAAKKTKTHLDHVQAWEDLYNKNRTETYINASEAAQSTFSTLAGVMKEGSKAQMAMLVMEKAMANVKAAIHIQSAMAEALDNPWPTNIAAMAQVAALGATIISNLAGMSTSVQGRASGGPVTPGGRYMVGEHGPEILQMGTGSGNVVKNEDISPKVNVTIVESGERAGTVEQDGNDIQVFVAAAMQHLNDEMSAGRGLFANMENRYGLSR